MLRRNQNVVQQVEDYDDSSNSFEVLYCRDGSSTSTRSFEDFSCDISSESTTADSLGDFGCDDLPTKDGATKIKKSRKENSKRTKQRTPSQAKFSLPEERKRPQQIKSRIKPDYEPEPFADRSTAIDRNEMLMLMKKIRRDRERAERDRETIESIQHSLSKLTVRCNSSTSKRTSNDSD